MKIVLRGLAACALLVLAMQPIQAAEKSSDKKVPKVGESFSKSGAQGPKVAHGLSSLHREWIVDEGVSGFNLGSLSNFGCAGDEAAVRDGECLCCCATQRANIYHADCWVPHKRSIARWVVKFSKAEADHHS